MKTLTETKLGELKKLAKSAIPNNQPLKGQTAIALILRGRGFGVRQIAGFLSENGVPVSPSAVSKFLKKHPETTQS
jgi:hypothetical protein